MLAESYMPYLYSNGGYYSALPIQTTSTVTSVGMSSTGSSTVSGGFTIGSTGTQLSNVSAGTCYLAPSGASIAASTTVIVDCQKTAAVSASGIAPLVGVRSGDKVVATLSTTTAGTTYSGLDIIGASASTTNGYISLTLSNQTGAAYTWPTSGIASGTASYMDVR